MKDEQCEEGIQRFAFNWSLSCPSVFKKFPFLYLSAKVWSEEQHSWLTLDYRSSGWSIFEMKILWVGMLLNSCM